MITYNGRRYQVAETLGSFLKLRHADGWLLYWIDASKTRPVTP